MKLLKRRPKSFDIQVHDMVLRISASPEYAEESRASALSFWEQLQSYGLRDPAFRESKRAIPVPEEAPDIVREMIARTITASHSKIRALLGLDPTQVEAIVTRVKAKQFPIERELVPNDLVAKMAILGSAEECTRRLAALHEAGADMIGVRPAGAILKALDYEGNVLCLHEAFKREMKE